MTPLVSVVIPTYNRARMLGRAVQSVLNQTFRDFECIVVDDGSTDGTSKLALFAGSDPRLSLLVLPENRGVSAARNAGVAASKGKWLAFLDSDDEWFPHKLERQVAWTTGHPEFEIVQTQEVWLRRGRRVNPPKSHEKSEGDLFEAGLERCMITPSSVMLTRRLFEEAGGFDERLSACEDYDLWLRVTARYPAGLVNEYLLTRYAGHEGQLSATVPVLDRFRVRSLLGLLEAGTLTEEQARLARKCLLSRAEIVAQGCRKRGNVTEYERYREIIRNWE